MAKTFKEHSKVAWYPNGVKEDSYPGHQRVIIGCLQRIADATEAMAKNYNRLLDDNQWFSEDRKRYMQRYETEKRRRSALKGVITRLKNKAPAP